MRIFFLCLVASFAIFPAAVDAIDVDTLIGELVEGIPDANGNTPPPPPPATLAPEDLQKFEKEAEEYKYREELKLNQTAGDWKGEQVKAMGQLGDAFAKEAVVQYEEIKKDPARAAQIVQEKEALRESHPEPYVTFPGSEPEEGSGAGPDETSTETSTDASTASEGTEASEASTASDGATEAAETTGSEGTEASEASTASEGTTVTDESTASSEDTPSSEAPAETEASETGSTTKSNDGDQPQPKPEDGDHSQPKPEDGDHSQQKSDPTIAQLKKSVISGGHSGSGINPSILASVADKQGVLPATVQLNKKVAKARQFDIKLTRSKRSAVVRKPTHKTKTEWRKRPRKIRDHDMVVPKKISDTHKKAPHPTLRQKKKKVVAKQGRGLGKLIATASGDRRL